MFYRDGRHVNVSMAQHGGKQTDEAQEESQLGHAQVPLDILALVASHISHTTDLNNLLRCSRATHQLRQDPQLQATWLLRTRGRPAAVHELCRRGLPDLLRTMLALGWVDASDLSTHDLARYTTLQHVCMACPASPSAQTELVQLLLKSPGMDVNAQGRMGTALHICCWKANLHVLGQLLDAPGVDVNASRAKDGNTPLHVACAFGHEEVVQLLLSFPGINPNTVNARGHTPLCTATWHGEAGVVQQLLSCRLAVDVNLASSRDGVTALQHACLMGNVAVVESLLAAPDIGVNAADHWSRWTPLHAAVTSNCTAVVHLVIKAGCDLHALAANGETALAIAQRCHREEIEDMLRGAMLGVL